MVNEFEEHETKVRRPAYLPRSRADLEEKEAREQALASGIRGQNVQMRTRKRAEQTILQGLSQRIHAQMAKILSAHSNTAVQGKLPVLCKCLSKTRLNCSGSMREMRESEGGETSRGLQETIADQLDVQEMSFGTSQNDARGTTDLIGIAAWLITWICIGIWVWFLVVLATAAHADEMLPVDTTPLIGAPYTGHVQALLHDVVGCTQIMDLVRLRKAHEDGDRAQFNRLGGQYISQGKCGMFYGGQAVYVISYGGNGLVTWVQPVGGLERIWVPFDAVLTRF